jgi:hypothetical protein
MEVPQSDGHGVATTDSAERDYARGRVVSTAHSAPAMRRTATRLGLRLSLGREHCIRAQRYQTDVSTLGCLSDSESEACPPEPHGAIRSRAWLIARCSDNLV